MNEATDVLQAIDQLRRDLSGYHGQLKAHNDLRRHCDNQRKRIVQLERLYAEAKAENAKLREQMERLQPKDCEGNALDIADTVSMLRSEYDGDHEWDDVVVELVLTKWGGDRWIVRGSKGEAWACDCAKTGYDEDAYEGSDDVEPIDNPTLVEAENANLRELASELYQQVLQDDAAWHDVRAWEDDLPSDCLHPIRSYDDSLGKHTVAPKFEQRMRELGIEVGE